MYLGARKVRSAGRNSGSVEVTLPVQLSVLEGVECRLVVRDGLRPELVLEPELGEVQSFFRDMWSKLSVGLVEIDEIDDFAPAEFTLTLFSPERAAERPPLTYADGLRALRGRPALGDGARLELGGATEALARVLAALGAAAGYHLGLARSFAEAFGDGLAYVMTGVPVGCGTEFERGTAHQAFHGESSADLGSRGRDGRRLSPYAEDAWRLAQSGLARVFHQFGGWQANPELYESDRGRWYMALALEMGEAMSASATATHDGRFSPL